MGNITGSIRDHTASKFGGFTPITRVQFIDNEIARSVAVGTIKCPGIIPAGTAGDATGTILRHAKGTVVGGGRRLFFAAGIGLLNTRTAVAGTSARTLIESYLTDAGDMDGVKINPLTTISWFVSAKRDGTAPFTEDARIEIEIVNERAVLGFLLLDTVETTLLTDAFFTYNGTTSGVSATFATDDQLALDIYIKNEGAPV